MNSAAGLQPALQRLSWLEKNNWLDLQTQWVGIQLFVLNPQLGAYNWANINIFFSNGGSTVPFVETHTFKAQPLQAVAIVCIGIFALLIFIIFVEFWLLVYEALKERAIKRFFLNSGHHVHFWTAHGGLFLLFNVYTSYASLGALMKEVLDLQSCGNRTFAFSNLTSYNVSYQWPSPLPTAAEVGGMTPDDAGYSDCLMNVHNGAAQHTGIIKTNRVYVAVFSLILIFRFFRVFAMQPKLAMLTNTIVTAWDQVFHHLIVSITIVCAYAVAGVLIFGRKEPTYGFVGGAICECFVVMLGSFDSERMAQDSPLTAFMWFYSYFILVGLIMLNCLMAIIMDNYAEVKSRATRASVEPIWTHMYRIARDAMYQRNVVHVKEIKIALKRHVPQHAMVDKDTLTNLIPGMSDTQSERLIAATVQKVQEEELNGHSLSQAMGFIGDISVDASKMLIQSDMLLQRAVLDHAELKASVAKILKEGFSPFATYVTCPRFEEYLALLENKLASLEQFVEESSYWTAYRNNQMHEQFRRIEEKLLERERSMRGKYSEGSVQHDAVVASERLRFDL
jgi:hypothetical protein